MNALTGKSSGPGVKIIRARLTVRGFKDRDKEQIARYAGTSSRSTQKVLVSEAVRNGWEIIKIRCIYISKGDADIPNCRNRSVGEEGNNEHM